MKMYKAFAAIVAISSVFVEAFAATETPPLIFFKDGKVGFNFFGFHGAAGLNALENGGGLHAEVGTPFGQQAAAGLNGVLQRSGKLGGQLYAGATAGGNVKAVAGLGGTLTSGDEPKAVGGLYSAASAGSANSGASMAGGVSDRGSFKIVEKVGGNKEPEKVAEVEKPPPHETENKIKKTYTVRGRPVKFDKFFNLRDQAKAPQDAGELTDLKASPAEDREVRNDQPATVNKEVSFNNPGSFLSQLFSSPTSSQSGSDPDGKNRNSFFNDIFNIPISTLSAVNQFLNNIPKTKPSNLVVEKTSTVF